MTAVRMRAHLLTLASRRKLARLTKERNGRILRRHVLRQLRNPCRYVEDLISRVIHVVKTSGTRQAVYLRGWDTLRAYSAGSVGKPPACKPCICTAAKTRGSKEGPPPHRGLFPCLPLPEKGESLEDRYVDFVIATSSFVAVSGNPVPLAAFRRPTSKEHVSLIGHIKRQFHDFLKGAVD